MNVKIIAAAVLMGFGALVCANELKIATAEPGGRLVDNINLPFVNDEEVLGDWDSVDFVAEPGEFTPGARRFGGDLYLKGMTFNAGGKMPGLSFTWTKCVILDKAYSTASLYTIKKLGTGTYLFFEWKSGDYTIRHQKPEYYVLKKK